MRDHAFIGALTLVVSIALGCTAEPSLDQVSAGKNSPGPSVPPGWQATLVPVTFEAWEQELRSMEGQIVVVDMWATWCLPCIERFPHMVKLASQYAERGVRFVSLCLDDRDDEDAIELAQRFLTEQRAEFPNFLMDEVVTRAFDKLDLLGIPAVFIYGPEGGLLHRLTGDDPNQQFTEADVESAIEELLTTG